MRRNKNDVLCFYNCLHLTVTPYNYVRQMTNTRFSMNIYSDTTANQDFGAPKSWCHMQQNSQTPLMLALCLFISTPAWNLVCAVLTKIQCCN